MPTTVNLITGKNCCNTPFLSTYKCILHGKVTFNIIG